MKRPAKKRKAVEKTKRAASPSSSSSSSTSSTSTAGSSEGELGVALDFMRLLWAVDHGLQRRSKRMEAELGVTGMQRIIIRLIGRYPKVTAGRLASLVHVHPSTLTGVLRRLVERGFVQRDRDRNDARIARFTLLAPGTTIDGTQAGTVESAARRALARMSAEKVDAARAVLAAVADELGRMDTPHKR